MSSEMFIPEHVITARKRVLTVDALGAAVAHAAAIIEDLRYDDPGRPYAIEYVDRLRYRVNLLAEENDFHAMMGEPARDKTNLLHVVPGVAGDMRGQYGSNIRSLYTQANNSPDFDPQVAESAQHGINVVDLALADHIMSTPHAA